MRRRARQPAELPHDDLNPTRDARLVIILRGDASSALADRRPRLCSHLAACACHSERVGGQAPDNMQSY